MKLTTDTIIPIHSTPTKPTKTELQELYSKQKMPLEHIGKLYGWKSSAPIKKLLTDYGIEITHLNKAFKPKCHDKFIQDLKRYSVTKLTSIYGVDRVKITKYINDNNLDIGYFKAGKVDRNVLEQMLSKDIVPNIAKELNMNVATFNQRCKYFKIDISSIKLPDMLMKELLANMFNSNAKVEGKTISHEPRLNEYLNRITVNHKLQSDKITERVYRVVNNYTPDQVDECTYCRDPLKFYTYVKGYGHTDANICVGCLSVHNSNGSSNISNEMFDTIYNRCDFLNETNTNYSNLNYEYKLDIPKHLVDEHSNSYFYSLDFVYNKKIIEFDGIYWHQNKEYELAKDAIVQELGFEILHIIDVDFKNNPEEVIERCIQFLKG